uniref:F-box and leucine-rich protein 22 isoform X1 n=1 Tax=Pristiophorus japonicus TaxID=55135 RepID=UPI00398F3640
MQLTELNRECLLHIFSFLDKANRKSLSRTCRVLREVFLEPALWSLLCFSSPSDLRKDNFVLSPALRSLSICWHSSRVKVCNIEDWMKSSFQRDICNRHSNLVNSFLLQISDRSVRERAASFFSSLFCLCKTKCPNLLSVTLSGCGHLTDGYIVQILQKCTKLDTLKLENCARLTDKILEAVTIYGSSLRTLHVDFCRNISEEGLGLVRGKHPALCLSAERSATMIPDQPDKRGGLGRAMKKRLLW